MITILANDNNVIGITKLDNQKLLVEQIDKYCMTKEIEK